ncbi:unnamed protein product [Blepharisma stoltei]|uniref:Tyrosine-protein kinase ephrin type A/B receptor-like domain-containing protein n=1 Tax=Blepharisma stoltei TaxID=1481888 RepID=A0AAU9JCF7_9CILI|nr:unnamed protein product [Blepharisma stoltei]
MYRIIIFILVSANAQRFTRIPTTDSPPSERQYLVLDYYDNGNSIIAFGGNFGSVSTYNDVWQFSLDSQLWTNLNPVSEISPVPRYFHGGFINLDDDKLYIFGGNSISGPQNDMWTFDLVNLQWLQIDQGGEIPSPRYRFGYKKYKDPSGALKFAIFGGTIPEGYDNNLYIFDIESLTWEKKPYQGSEVPRLNGPVIEYWNQAIYVAAGDISEFLGTSEEYSRQFFRYDLASNNWVNITNPSHTFEYRYFTGSILYNDVFYLLYGWSDETSDDVTNIMKVDLNDPEYIWTYQEVAPGEFFEIVPRDSYGFTMHDHYLYMLGGYSALTDLLLNSLIEFDLDTDPLEYKIISYEYVNPNARKSHSICALGGFLYLFGGENNGEAMNDLWVFDPDKAIWSSIVPQGDIPSARKNHAASSQGDTMVVFGGYDGDFYLNDLHLLNILTDTWSKIEPASTVRPSGRSNACMQINFPHIYIFGGLTKFGLTNEIWVFDTLTNEFGLVYDGYKIGPEPVKNPACDFRIDPYGNSILFTMYGSTHGEKPLGRADMFNFTTKIWTNLAKSPSASDPISRDEAIIKSIGSYIAIIGGQKWGTDPLKSVYILNIPEHTYQFVGNLPDYFYASAYIYYKKSIYVHGGGAVLGKTMRTSIGKSNFIEINIKCPSNAACVWTCSPGTYLDNGECYMCPKGSYNEKYGAKECILCPPGTYNPSKGGNTSRQCYPCDEGTFNANYGALICRDCPTSKYCPIGASSPLDKKTVSSYLSLQPSTYSSYDTSLIINLLILTAGLVCIVTLLFTVLTEDVRKYYSYIDIYQDIHNHTLNATMYMKSTKLGGAFTLIFIFVAVVMICSEVLNYSLDNVTEIKNLLPSVSLENDVKEYPANITVSALFYQYGGNCVVGIDSCNQGISYTHHSISFERSKLTCSKVQDRNCQVTFWCTQCIILIDAYIEFYLVEKSSYTSAISVNVTASSSIPHERSSIFQSIIPADKTLFRGFDATQFYFTMTPSLFRSYVDDWTDELTGYHVSLTSPPSPGSQYEVKDLPFTSSLKLKIWLKLSENSLYTERIPKQTFIALISGLLGAVFGSLSAIGITMAGIENIFIIYKRKFRRENDVLGIGEKRSKIMTQFEKNTDYFISVHSPPESEYDSCWDTEDKRLNEFSRADTSRPNSFIMKANNFSIINH